MASQPDPVEVCHDCHAEFATPTHPLGEHHPRARSYALPEVCNSCLVERRSRETFSQTLSRLWPVS